MTEKPRTPPHSRRSGSGRAREQTMDRHGRPLAPGTRVRVVGEDGQPEGTIVRVMADYDVVTVLIEKGAKAERMYPVADVEAL